MNFLGLRGNIYVLQYNLQIKKENLLLYVQIRKSTKSKLIMNDKNNYNQKVCYQYLPLRTFLRYKMNKSNIIFKFQNFKISIAKNM